MNSPAIRQEHRQHQTLTPRLQQAVRLLQLSSLDFAQEVRDAMGKNPFLEPEDSAGADAAEIPDTPPVAEPVAAAASEALDAETPSAMSDAEPSWERDSWQSATGTRNGSGGDSDTSMIDMVADDPGLRAYLRGQMNAWPLSDRERVLVTTIIESLDDDGYLRTPLMELAALAELSPTVTEAEMEAALAQVQTLDPMGVGARSVSECLLLQVPSIEDEQIRDLARIIVTHYLSRLAQRDVAGLAKTLSCKPADIDAACERIRHLDPRPGWRFGAASETQFVTPDVIVKQIRGEWVASLNPAVVPRVRINQMYAELFQKHRDSNHAELAANLQEARWTVRNVEQRFSTILTVSQAILKRQHHFLEFGPLAMKPLGLREIAEEVGLHESTVCRVTNNKFMATPVGVFELKYFFSRAMPTASGGECSATAIRGVIKDMIDAENLVNPLSDAEIARQLARQGLQVARRTVTKYRQLLKVPPVDRRRKHAA
ncbi:RNA polymerase factor sigma-54 [Aquabacterium sp.]|uniref:RNA polymerase factor sigma-54 n=1 Tax=Aquabacterium sp. TaxID=1872578 RepID=UPI003D6CCB32